MAEFIEVSPAHTQGMTEKVRKQIADLGVGKIVKRNENYTQIAVMVKDEGEKVLKIFEVLSELIPQVIEPAAQFWEDIKAAFSALPQRIDVEIGVPKSFILTLQPAEGKALDRVLYLSLIEETCGYLIFQETEAPTIFKAKRMMYDKLRDKGFL